VTRASSLVSPSGALPSQATGEQGRGRIVGPDRMAGAGRRPRIGHQTAGIPALSVGVKPESAVAPQGRAGGREVRPLRRLKRRTRGENGTKPEGSPAGGQLRALPRASMLRVGPVPERLQYFFLDQIAWCSPELPLPMTHSDEPASPSVWDRPSGLLPADRSPERSSLCR
jgi:hypothetical protein